MHAELTKDVLKFNREDDVLGQLHLFNSIDTFGECPEYRE
jgi:hypothetical protein